MAFDTSNDFTEFDGIGSGESGTVEGLLPIEGSASSFRYRKQIDVEVEGAQPDDFTQDPTGTWTVRVREDASRNAAGHYIGAILFEQTVKWTAHVLAFGLGGIDFISWSPEQPAGAGRQHTPICNGEECSVIDNIFNPTAEELTNYEQNGAWRFIDGGLTHPGESAADLYNIERGFVTPESFEPTVVATIGGFKFSCEWQSANYLCDIPEGAILETVQDHWQYANVDTEAQYKFSYKPGEDLTDALSDAWSGQKWWFHKADGAMRCARTRMGDRSYKHSLYDPPVLTGAFGSFRAFRLGSSLFVLHQRGAGVGLRFSRDDGRIWDGIADMVQNVKQIDSIFDGVAGEIIMLGTAKVAMDGAFAGDLVRVILTQTDEKDASDKPLLWKVKQINKIATRGGNVLPNKPKGRLTRSGSTIEWSLQDGNDVEVWISTDRAATFELAPASE